MRTLLVVTLLFCAPSFVYAQVLFNEVELLPTEERFIELYNSGDTDVDLTGWYIQRKTATGNTFGSLVASSKFENKIIKAHGYFLIARSALPFADISLDTLSLTESNTLLIKDPEREVIDQLAWGALDEGKSYQKTATGEWVIAERTPREENLGASGTLSVETTRETLRINEVISGGITSIVFQNQKIAIDIGPKERNVLMGSTIMFEGRVEGADKKPIDGTQMKWSFGDGAMQEGWGITSVSHTYYYPGEYNVFLEFPAFFTTSPRVRVRVVMPEIAVHTEGHRGRSAIVIENRMKEDLDLTGWKLSSEGKTFIFPATIIGAKKSVLFPSEITLLTATEDAPPELYFPNGVRVPLISSEPQHISSSTPSIISLPTTTITSSINKKIISGTQSVIAEQNMVPSVSTQQAQVFESREHNPPQSNYALEKHNEKIWIWYSSIFFLGALALIGFLFARNKKTRADEFEIIEETR